MGLILTTSGWTGASITWTHADGADTYTVAGDELNSYDVAQALRDWLDAPARPWSGSIAAVTLAVGDSGTRHRYEYSFTGSAPTFVSVSVSSAWSSRFGDTSADPEGAAVGTMSIVPETHTWDRWDESSGLRSRDGGFRMAHPTTAHRRPSVRLVMTLSESYTLSECLRVAARATRTAYVYDERSATWRIVTLGQVTQEHPQDDVTIVVATLEVLG